MVRPGGGDPGRRGRELPCYRSPAAPSGADHVRPRSRRPRPGPGPPGERWPSMVTASSTHHQRLGQATRPSAARTRRPLRTSTHGKAVMPTQDTPTSNSPTLDPPSGPPLGGSTAAPSRRSDRPRRPATPALARLSKVPEVTTTQQRLGTTKPRDGGLPVRSVV